MPRNRCQNHFGLTWQHWLPSSACFPTSSFRLIGLWSPQCLGKISPLTGGVDIELKGSGTIYLHLLLTITTSIVLVVIPLLPHRISTKLCLIVGIRSRRTPSTGSRRRWMSKSARLLHFRSNLSNSQRT